ncbi:MAG: hypothetical protein K8H88_32455 [Sandaracinaceae bacterium]|nr:hypothetical protein [Sandaracinaceae bacterium]
MARSKRISPAPSAPLYAQLVLFPERAEYLEQERFHSYRIRLDHWRALADVFRRGFEAVYERQSAQVLLVHGEQGTGKTLFTRKLEDDFEKPTTPDLENLWHVLAGGQPPSAEVIAKAKDTTALRRVEPVTGWLAAQRQLAREDKHAMRVFLIDDVHKDVFLREWAELSQGDYLRLKADGKDQAVIESVAQKLVEDCRGDFKRSLFVLLSNDAGLLERLHAGLERSHRGLAQQVSLPMPEPALKEEIVRTNTNRLNQRSYWYCLDQGGPREKTDAYETLTGTGGFVDAFLAINRAFAARTKRTGRPANKNLLTLATLGVDPAEVTSYLADHELEAHELAVEPHVGVWLFRETWASVFTADDDGDYARRASLVESEFSLRWVALDMAATHRVCTAPRGDAVAGALVQVLAAAPSIADKAPTKTRAKQQVYDADRALHAVADADAVAAFAESFRSAGQARAQQYEPAIADRLGRALSVGLQAWGSLKPDIILAEYEPCAVTRASSPTKEAIEAAIRRQCHVLELTTYLQRDQRGLDDYIRGKVRVYSDLLESV